MRSELPSDEALRGRSFIDYLAERLGCVYVSDLRYLRRAQQQTLALELEKLPAEAVSLREWNDALEYLTGAFHQPTAEAAKEKLLEFLWDSGPNP